VASKKKLKNNNIYTSKMRPVLDMADEIKKITTGNECDRLTFSSSDNNASHISIV